MSIERRATSEYRPASSATWSLNERVVHYKLGGRVMFRREDIDQFVDQNKRELPDVVAWQLKGRTR